MEKEIIVIKQGLSLKKIEVTPLYTRLFGENKNAKDFLNMLGFHKENIPRFRDCLLVRNPELMFLVYTRTGGPNRDQYDSKNQQNPIGPWNSSLRENKYYIRDEDCKKCNTYACFYFKIPELYKSLIEEKYINEVSLLPVEIWRNVLDNNFKNIDINDEKHKNILDALAPYSHANFKEDIEAIKNFRDFTK